MHHLTYDLGRRQGTRIYYPGRDSSNCIVRCSCGWAFSSTIAAIYERGPTHLHAFRNEVRMWNDPKRTTPMPRAD